MPEVRAASGEMTLRLGDHAVGGERHERVEARRREPVGEVEEVVRLVRVHEGEVGAQRRLQQVLASVPCGTSSTWSRPSIIRRWVTGFVLMCERRAITSMIHYSGDNDILRLQA